MSKDPHVQSFYNDGVNASAAEAAGRWQAQTNPTYTPPQQHNETWYDFLARTSAQDASSRK